MTIQPTVSGPDPTSPAWYPDPDPGYRDRYERYWTGEGWRPPGTPLGRRPVGGKAATDGATPRSSAKLRRWYWLACMLPFTLAVLAPYAVGSARSYPFPGGGGWDPVLDHPAMIATGWALFAVGLLGTVVGTVVFSKQRQEGGVAERNWNSGAWTVAVIVGLFGILATSLTNADYAPPRDAAMSSAKVPIGAKVDVSTDGGRFTVLVESIQCDWWNCDVSQRVTNTGVVAAEYPCSDTTATASDGEVVGAGWVSLGSSGTGCEPPTVQPGETASVTITLFEVHDRQLVALIVPGADDQIDLPEVDR